MSDIRVFLEFKIPGRSTSIVDTTYGSEAFVDISTRVDYDQLTWENVSSSNTAVAKVKIFTVDPINTADYTTFADPAGSRDSLTTAVQDPTWYFDVADRAELRIHDISGGAAVQNHSVLFAGVVTRVSVYREPGFIIQELEVADSLQLLSENIVTKYYHPNDSHADDAISNATAITTTVTYYSSLPLPEAGSWNGTAGLSSSSVGLRKNIVTNPSFEVDATGWVAASSTIAQSATQAFSGTKSLLVTGTAAIGSGAKQTASYKPVVVPSTQYSLAGRIRLVTGTTTASIAASIEWYDSSNVLISTSTAGTSVVPTSTGWSLVRVGPITSPSNAVYGAPKFVTTNAVAANWYLDGVQMEAETYDSTVTYFDGSSTSAGGTTGSRAKTTADGRTYRLDEDPSTLARSWVYATIFDATNDPTRFDNILDRSTYVYEVANGSYRFSPYFSNTQTYLPEQRGGRTLLQAIQEMAANEGAAYWIDPGYFDASGYHVRRLHYGPKEINNLVSNSVFEDGSSTGWNLADVGTFTMGTSTSGPYGTGYSIYATGTGHSDAAMANGYRINCSYGEKFFVSWRVNTQNAPKSHPHVRYYHADGTVHGNSHGYQIATTQSIEGRWTRNWGIIAPPDGGATPVTSLGIVLNHEAHTSAYQVNYTDIRVVKITSGFGFSDDPSETAYSLPLRDFEVPSAPKESGVVANRVLVYGIYKSVDSSNGQTVMLTGGTGEPIRYLSYDYVQGVWQSGGKIVEAVIVDPLVQTSADAKGRAQAFFDENGLPLISYKFKHNTTGLNIGDIVPFVWNAVGVAEPLVVKAQSSYMIGLESYYEIQLGGDIQIQKSTILALQQSIDYINQTPITDLGPLTPDNVAAVGASGAITVTWDFDFSHARNENFNVFEVYRSAGGGAYALVNTTSATAWSDTAGTSGLDTNQTYQYQVRAVDKDNFYSSMSAATAAVSPEANTITFDDAYNGLGINVPKIIRSVSYNGTPTIKTITSISRTLGSATVTVTAAAHGFSALNVVVITGTGVTSFDGTYTIDSVATNTFTYTSGATTAASASTGKAAQYIISGAYVDKDGVSRNLGDAYSLVQFPKGQVAFATTDGKLYRNGTSSYTSSVWDNKWTRAAADAIDVGPGGTVTISADRVLAGTLDAGVVNVTNLNASEIKSGSISLSGLNSTNAITSTNFTVSNTGAVTASSLSITGGPSGGNVVTLNSGAFAVSSLGAVTATSGTIGGLKLSSGSIYNQAATKYTGFLNSTTDTGVSFYAGATAATGTGATFKVQNDGGFTAGKLSVSSGGALSATSGYFNPDTSRSAIIVAGDSTQGDIAAASTDGTNANGTLHLGVTTARGTDATGSFTTVMRLTKTAIYLDKAVTFAVAPSFGNPFVIKGTSTDATPTAAEAPKINFDAGQGTIMASITADANSLDINKDVTITNSGGLTTETGVVAGTSIYAGGTGGTGNVYADFFLSGDQPGNANTANTRGVGIYGANTSGYIVVSRQSAAQTDYAMIMQADTWSAMTTWYAVRFRRALSAGAVYSNVGYISVTSSTTTAPSFIGASDYRMKENIRTAKDYINMLQKVNELRPVLFDNAIDPNPAKDQLGFIAHEVQAVVPDAVDGKKDAVDENGNPVYQHMADSKFMPYVIGAIQGLSEKIDSIESRLAELSP